MTGGSKNHRPRQGETAPSGGLWYGSWWTEKVNLPPEGEQWTEKELTSAVSYKNLEAFVADFKAGMQQVDENAVLDTLEIFAEL